jgi:hypothetical protein
MAQWLGRMINAELMGGMALTSTSQGRTLLRSAKRLGKRAAAAGWNGAWVPEEKELAALRACWLKTLALDQTPFRAGREQAATVAPRLWCLATDASDGGGGWILFRRATPMHDWSEVTSAAWRWNPAEFKLGIYEKEMLALQRGVRDTKAQVRGEALFVVVDNAAAAWGLRAGFTNHSFGMSVLESVAPLLSDAEIVLVISADNPADCPSRANNDDLAVRVTRMQKAIACHEKGWHWTSEPLKSWINARLDETEDRLRHDPPGETWMGPEESESDSESGADH